MGKQKETWQSMFDLINEGNLEGAELFLARLRRESSAPEDLSGALFFYGVALVRQSRYRGAYKIFRETQELYRISQSIACRYFFHQGFCFFYYYVGYYEDGHRFARAAIKAALELNEGLLALLAYEMSGHLSMALGHVREGFLNLERAEKIAREENHDTFLKAIQVAALKYRSQWGLAAKTTFEELRDALESLHPSDIYSQAELGLEFARQLTLRGSALEAQRILDKVCGTIYQHKIRRQVATLNLRFAYLQWLRGEKFQALNLTHVSLANLHPQADGARREQVLGLQRLILEQGAGPKNAGIFPHLRILARDRGDFGTARGDDPLGDLIDDLSRGDPDSIRRAVDEGYLGLLRHVPALKFQLKDKPLLVFNLLPQSLFAFHRGDVVVLANKLDPRTHRLLEALFGGAWKSKEELIQRLWHYTYHPLRHDALVYNAIANIRKTFGVFSYLIESSEEGYRLSTDLNILDLKPRSLIAAYNEITSPASLAISNELNHRQLQLLDILRNQRFLSASESAVRLNCSIPTACRDLSQLFRRGLLKRCGNTRATRYFLALENSETSAAVD